MIDRQAKNKMSLNNVTVIMAPNIFMFKGFRSKVTEQQEYSMAAGTANIMRLLIRYQNLLWTVRNKELKTCIFFDVDVTFQIFVCVFSVCPDP